MFDDMGAVLAMLLFLTAFVVLLSGFPVAFALGGAAVIFAFLGMLSGDFVWGMMSSVAGRMIDLMTNETLVAVPLFVFMGVVLERSQIAEDLLITMGQAFGKMPGGLGISVILVGGLLAASTGVVGATVLAMGLISLPAMIRANYNKSLASGIICASGTMAQLIPPSTVLIMLGIMLQNANTQANLKMGKFDTSIVTITDLFAAALLPGLILMVMYILYVMLRAFLKPSDCPALVMTAEERKTLLPRILAAVVPPVTLILMVLGSILTGIATATESAAVGAIGACLLAVFKRRFALSTIWDVSKKSLVISNMIFAILIGATLFSMVFRGLGGEEVIEEIVSDLPGGVIGATIFVLLLMFLLGFLIDTFEIIFIVAHSDRSAQGFR